MWLLWLQFCTIAWKAHLYLLFFKSNQKLSFTPELVIGCIAICTYPQGKVKESSWLLPSLLFPISCWGGGRFSPILSFAPSKNVRYNLTFTWWIEHRKVIITACKLRESNLIETTAFTTWFNERNWFSYLDFMKIFARIDPMILTEFDAQYYFITDQKSSF